eukprot:5522276-Pyramimonas_sp.AAC.1
MADVLNGVCSSLDRLGNKHADIFARLVAGMHPVPDMMVQALDACRAVQEGIVRWGAIQDVIMADRGWVGPLRL